MGRMTKMGWEVKGWDGIGRVGMEWNDVGWNGISLVFGCDMMGWDGISLG